MILTTIVGIQMFTGEYLFADGVSLARHLVGRAGGCLMMADAGEPQDKDRLDLSKDPRLLVKLSFTLKRAPMDEALDQVRKATQVDLDVAPEITAGQTYFGTMTSHNCPAWKILEDMSRTQVKNGKWEKQGDGYVLRGLPVTTFEPQKRPTLAKKNEEPTPTNIWPLLAVVLGVGLVLAGMLYLRHWYKDRPAKT